MRARIAPRWLACLSSVFCVSAPQAGLGLDAALARSEQLETGLPCSRFAPAAAEAGVLLGAGGARPAQPQLIAQPLPGRGGLGLTGPSFSSGALEGQFALVVRDGRSPWATLEGTALTLDPTRFVGAPPQGAAAGGPPPRCGVSRGDGWGEIYASVQRRHWGPGWAGSIILDAAAPAVPALGWRREVQASDSPWLSWLAPWGADVFFGRLQGHEQPRRPWLIGMRLQFAPGDRLEIGLSRTMQWGGAGRDERWSSLRHSLLGNDNVGFSGINAANEPGNQLAGVDVRWLVDPVAQVSVYLQVIGEDEAGHLPSRNMPLLGIDAKVPTDRGSLRFFAELTDLLAGRVADDPRPAVTYRHSVYRQGYTQEGYFLGHPAGGDVLLAVAGWVYRRGPGQAMASLAAGRAEPTSQLFTRGRVLGFNAAGQWALDDPSGLPAQIGAHATWWSDRAGRRRAVQVWWRGAMR